MPFIILYSFSCILHLYCKLFDIYILERGTSYILYTSLWCLIAKVLAGLILKYCSCPSFLIYQMCWWHGFISFWGWFEFIFGKFEKGNGFMVSISKMFPRKSLQSSGRSMCLYPDRKWQDYVYIQCEYKSTKQKIKHLLREENKVKENEIS